MHSDLGTASIMKQLITGELGYDGNMSCGKAHTCSFLWEGDELLVSD